MRDGSSPFFPDGEGVGLPFRDTRRHDWVESSGDFEVVNQMQEFLGVSVAAHRIWIFFLISVIILMMFFVRTAYLQVFEGRGWALIADRNKVKTQVLEARRGIIYDRAGAVLVRNEPNFVIRITPAELPRPAAERLAVLQKVSKHIGMSVADIEKEMKGESVYQPQTIIENIPYKDALYLDVALSKLPGVTIFQSQRRSYIRDGMESISHVIGYTGKINEKELSTRRDAYFLNDKIGKEGIELQYEEVMRGVFGRRHIEVDALGVEKGVLALERATDGRNLILTIDARIQKKAEEILKSWLEKSGKARGVLIATDPKNGEVLAMVSVPAYDTNMFARGVKNDEYAKLRNDPDKPLFNRTIYGEYPSGSTIKPVVAAAALQEKVATISTTVVSTGGLRIGAWTFPDWKPGGHGVTNVVKAISQSVNTYFYTVGGGNGSIAGLGVDRLTEYYRKFGLGERTGIDMINERDGFVPSQEWKEKATGEKWYIGDTYHIAIGQGQILVTPLQVHQFMSYFANNGTSYKPRLVKKIVDNEGQVQEVVSEISKKDLVSQENTAIVREGMRQTVVSGSGRRLSQLPVSAAGKTGTAQWAPGKDNHAWFTGWAPFENPDIAVTVLVEEGEEGSAISSPITHELMKWYFSEIKPTKKPALTPKK